MLTYTPTNALAENTTYFLSVYAINGVGESTSCAVIEFESETLPTGPACPVVTTPVNNATDVAINPTFNWNAADRATSYRITIGTTSGGTEFENTTLGNVLTYTPTNALAENTTYFVSVFAINSVGNSASCAVIEFKTETLPTAPACPVVTAPVNNATDVAINPIFNWNAADGATSYRITIGTTSGGTEFENTTLGNVLTYTPTNALAENTTYFVSVFAINSLGNSASCAVIEFKTETLPTAPACPVVTAPVNNATDVAINPIFNWNATDGATSYRITIGTTSGGTEFENTTLGNVLTYTPTNALAENTTYFLSVYAINGVGESTSCAVIEFETETLPTAPACPVVTTPVNTATEVAINPTFNWDTADGATSYRITIGTTSGGTEFENTKLGNVLTYTPINALAENTTYFVSVFAINSVGESTSCAVIEFETIISSAQTVDEIPKFFTPNNDGSNDYWQVTDDNGVVKQVRVFDRYGKVLKEFKSNTLGWDGNYFGKQMPSDDYWYMIIYNDGSVIKGHFSLIRR
ncbi:T9SS type B sorting domain-containing protein [Aureibaculum sp. A20]|uniref:T9SS type B sorting domain-containing protein n=1 Tax=Aureibaculum flavum TaxID=2795986 RepID=A0ABS0WUW5_9FLAO|nr:T9SS type B sorting domain-containing protein [Aureibaculum flavum]MBJ2175701.1 T9SS type B sorting domain-containing protein [Aureibaculum flavum]